MLPSSRLCISADRVIMGAAISTSVGMMNKHARGSGLGEGRGRKVKTHPRCNGFGLGDVDRVLGGFNMEGLVTAQHRVGSGSNGSFRTTR